MPLTVCRENETVKIGMVQNGSKNLITANTTIFSARIIQSNKSRLGSDVTALTLAWTPNGITSLHSCLHENIME